MSAGMPSLPEYVLTHPVKQRPTQMPAGPSVRIRPRHKCLQMCKCRRACKCANVRKYANFGECWRMAANVQTLANVGKCGRRRTRRRESLIYIGAQKKMRKKSKKIPKIFADKKNGCIFVVLSYTKGATASNQGAFFMHIAKY